MRIADVVFILVFLGASSLSANDGVIQTDDLTGTWQELPLPPSKHPWVSAIALEPGGVLWAMANNTLHYWDGRQFRSPAVCDRDGKPYESNDEKPAPRFYLTRFYGGPDRGLFVTQRGEKAYEAKLYELTDGRAIHVTNFYCEPGPGAPWLYVSKSGRLFSWGRRFLAVYDGDKWKRIEVALAHPVILDTGKKVYFYGNQQIYSVDQDGKLESREFVAPT